MLEKTTESPLVYKEIKPVNPEENQPLTVIERPRRADLLEKTLMLGKTEGKRRRGWQRMRWLDSITNRLNGLEFEQTLGDSEGQGSHVLQFMVLQGVRHQLSD